MRVIAIFTLVAGAALADSKSDHPTGNRTTPPTINVVSPRGVARGTTVEMTIEGLNLTKASAIYFSEKGITGRIVRVKELPDLPDIRLGSNGTPSTIDLGPLPPRNQVTVELDVSPDAEIGPVRFRVQTPLGTSPDGNFLIEPYYGESPDREPNDTPEGAFETYLPTILVGAVARPGDVDYYRIEVKAGVELVFDDGGPQAGSTLQPVITIETPDHAVVREFGNDGRPESRFAHKFEKAGTYYVKVADYQQSGRGSHTYRIKLGEFPVARSAWPLGIERGKTREIAVRGYHTGAAKLAVKGEPSPEDENAVILRPKTPKGPAFNEVKLALGREPETDAAATSVSLQNAQPVTVPVTVNGRVGESKSGVPVENYFRFKARKGQKLTLEVNARRLGSELDSVIEVLDAKGGPIERATARAVLETSLTLRDHDSVQRGLRISSWSGFNVGEYVMIGGEILRIDALPRTPDDDMIFESFGGQRITFFDTTSEAHALDKPMYKVQFHPPGAQFAPNGLPLVRLNYRNDDGGPGYGKDSLLRFTAPADGEYIARIRDVRGMGGDDFAYRLTIREPRPDFRLSVTPRNLNVPVGGSVPVTVTAFRLDEFSGAIEVTLVDLPPGLTATHGIIGPRQNSAALIVSAAADAKLDAAVALKALGKARVGTEELAHYASPEDRLKLVSLMPKPDILVVAETKEVVLEPGGTAEVALNIQRQNNFGGRVPVDVLNLPPRVRVLDVGLNGVLINEDENRRTFTLEALPMAEPVEQVIYVAGVVETRSPLPYTHAAVQAIRVKVKPASAAAVRPAATSASTAPR